MASQETSDEKGEASQQVSAANTDTPPCLVFLFRGTRYEYQCEGLENRPMQEVLSNIREVTARDASSLRARISSDEHYLDGNVELATVLEKLVGDKILLVEEDLVSTGHFEAKVAKAATEAAKRTRPRGPTNDKNQNEALTKFRTEIKETVIIGNLGLVLLPQVMMSQLHELQNDRELRYIHLFLGLFVGACISLLAAIFDANKGFLIGGMTLSFIVSIVLFFLERQTAARLRNAWERIKTLTVAGRHETEQVIRTSSDIPASPDQGVRQSPPRIRVIREVQTDGESERR